MRIQIRIQVLALVVALVVAGAVGLSLLFLGFGLASQAAALALGPVVFLGVVMAQDAMTIRELVKQIAVWLGVVILLPLVVWYGTSAFSPPPDAKEYSRSTSRIDEQIKETAVQAEKEKLRQERERLEKEHEEAERVHYGHMFWVAYPIGLVAVIIGTFFPVQAIGAGLMFGGLISLAAGCYSYWDKMDGWLRFGSLIVALAVLLVLGTWRFRSRE